MNEDDERVPRDLFHKVAALLVMHKLAGGPVDDVANQALRQADALTEQMYPEKAP